MVGKIGSHRKLTTMVKGDVRMKVSKDYDVKSKVLKIKEGEDKREIQ